LKGDINTIGSLGGDIDNWIVVWEDMCTFLQN